MYEEQTKFMPCPETSLSAPLMEHICALEAELCRRGLRCAVAESCTGGLLGAALTAVPGASACVAGGIIAYANAVKVALLGVDPATLEAEGAVSEAVVRQMATGACRALGVEAAMSVSGIAGPDGGSTQKPVGTVWFGIALQGEVHTFCRHFAGDRAAVRQAAVATAINGLRECLAIQNIRTR